MIDVHRLGVISVSIHPNITGARRSLEEILFDVTREALADARLDIEAIDGIVVAANHQYDGRGISIMAASGSVGGVDRDIHSTPSAGEHAFVLGATFSRAVGIPQLSLPNTLHLLGFLEF